MRELSEHESTSRLPADDSELIRRVCAGDSQAIDELLNKRCGSMIRFLAHRFSYPDLGGDLYLNLNKNEWQKLTIWRAECPLTKWIRIIAMSMCIERARREKRLVFVEPEILITRAGGATPDFDKPLRRRDLMRAIQSLKNPRQRAILLGILQGCPIQEIADTLRITRQNADTLKSRAIDEIQTILHPRGREDNA